MTLLLRMFATAAAFVGSVVGGQILIYLLLPGGIAVAASVLAWVLAAWVAHQVWTRLARPDNGLPASVLLWACALGGIGFAIGFFGPILFMPGANQGPLLGIFYTGPGGFVLGGIVGLVRWLKTGR